jgi:hypothetical protein
LAKGIESRITTFGLVVLFREAKKWIGDERDAATVATSFERDKLLTPVLMT